jgi:membrane fusion protein (multidrug efflux system)
VRAPFSGRLGIRQVDLGEYLGVGTQIVTLQQLNPLYVDFYLPQQALSQVQVGQDVQIGADAFPGQNFDAHVTAIGSAVDTSTRTIAVQATLPNDDLKLLPGMFATVNVDIGAPQQEVTLPQTAITYNPYGDTVYILHPYQANGASSSTPPPPKGTYVATQQFVTTGDTRGDQVAIMSGVSAGDIVVSAGQLKLRNGVLVSINNSVQPPNSPNPNPPNE